MRINKKKCSQCGNTFYSDPDKNICNDCRLFHVSLVLHYYFELQKIIYGYNQFKCDWYNPRFLKKVFMIICKCLEFDL